MENENVMIRLHFQDGTTKFKVFKRKHVSFVKQSIQRAFQSSKDKPIPSMYVHIDIAEGAFGINLERLNTWEIGEIPHKGDPFGG